jgi:hypothetical protein
MTSRLAASVSDVLHVETGCFVFRIVMNFHESGIETSDLMPLSPLVSAKAGRAIQD